MLYGLEWREKPRVNTPGDEMIEAVSSIPYNKQGIQVHGKNTSALARVQSQGIGILGFGAYDSRERVSLGKPSRGILACLSEPLSVMECGLRSSG